MKQAESRKRVQELFREHEKLITRKNVKAKSANGVYDRYANPVSPYGRLPGAFGKRMIHHKGHSERSGTQKLERNASKQVFASRTASEGGPCTSEL